MTTATNDHSEKTVLIVDDVEYSRQLLRNCILSVCDGGSIQVKRFKIINAANAQVAFSKIEQEKPDIIFLDIELPDINGIEILKRIKSEHPGSFVIMVSGQSTIANVKESLTSGAAGFIVKPFSGDKVMEALKNYEKKVLKG